MIDEEKKRIRKEIRTLKNAISLEEKTSRSIVILENVEQLPEFIEAKTVMLYWAMADEVQTSDFVIKWAASKRVILPCVNGNTLDLRVFRGVEDLVAGENFGIPEPSGELFTAYDEIDLILVPGVAFDVDNNRMGRGKAYYDKLLSSLKAFKLGVCFYFQLLESVPTDEHDIKMDQIVSE
ncbi:5-formyltetrahydrofolate cyclo-ligase [Ancylomarina euxinus]|uniref:5-formyltetrahydrofolate cyclo-ligase n=1 Tax=Ancylomarina euxinus TaxID=2283627 RepID=A0A425Y5F4_9BACT|nr:5-formyltetrahydrofolate cyclo-ligase [Ancylomarina euxinus]MCZ4694417.1 5-formyltetrahydrofolate cyclo-ligase [Ancylomarina euxinus]MUP14253.1 5-formyltetrahydrofolate cyclo-ligase [Ancylomarina euxinus]RRG23574.1 5-formyltetrahydrofolate cyclo-ligase [Ancylomarina euxinus]